MAVGDLILNKVLLPHEVNGRVLVSDIKKLVDDYFGDAKYAKRVALDRSDPYSKKTFVPIMGAMELAWVHAEQQFLTIDIANVDDDELYIIEGKCYRGTTSITTDEYNDYVSRYTNTPAAQEDVEKMVDEVISTDDTILEPVTKIEAGWVHSAQEFQSVDLNDLDENELYVLNSGYYLGSKKIPMNEYMELTEYKKHIVTKLC